MMGGSNRGRVPGPELGTARMLQRRVMMDALAEHPDVFRYLAEQAADLASEFPGGSREHLTLVLFDQASRGVADMLEQAAQVKAS